MFSHIQGRKSIKLLYSSARKRGYQSLRQGLKVDNVSAGQFTEKEEALNSLEQEETKDSLDYHYAIIDYTFAKQGSHHYW